MLVGIIADTHDNLKMVDLAVEKFNEKNVELVLHSGDYIAPFVVPRFNRLNGKLIGVLGNNDGDHKLLKERFNECERLEVRENFAKIIVDGLKIALLHGDEEELLEALVDSEYFDIVVFGHTHRAEICQKGKTLIVNPGEVCGYLSGKSTIALLDTVTLKAEIVGL